MVVFYSSSHCSHLLSLLSSGKPYECANHSSHASTNTSRKFSFLTDVLEVRAYASSYFHLFSPPRVTLLAASFLSFQFNLISCSFPFVPHPHRQHLYQPHLPRLHPHRSTILYFASHAGIVTLQRVKSHYIQMSQERVLWLLEPLVL